MRFQTASNVFESDCIMLYAHEVSKVSSCTSDTGRQYLEFFADMNVQSLIYQGWEIGFKT